MKIRNELDLIASIAKKPKSKEVIMGIGDDAAVIKKSKDTYWLVGADMLMEKDHFSLDYFTPKQVGFKSMESNVSDMAAMGGTAKYAFISIALRKGMGFDFVKKFYQGLYASAKRHGVEILGGDTTHGQVMSVSITIIGECKKKNLCLRSAAKPGDYILVSGPLGASTAGLNLFLKKKKGFASVKKKHLEPRARLDIAEKIAPLVNAMEDVSDGLASEVRNICYASKTGAVITAESVPIANQTIKAAESLKTSALDYALFGGEDFELVFTCDKKNLKKLQKFGSVVGRITKGRKILLEKKGKKTELKKFGYDHFTSPLNQK